MTPAEARDLTLREVHRNVALLVAKYSVLAKRASSKVTSVMCVDEIREATVNRSKMEALGEIEALLQRMGMGVEAEV